MTILTPEQGEICVSIVTIGFGLFIEKWYVSRSSIMMNVITWFILLFTINIGYWVFVVMACWLILGFLLTFVSGLGGIKQLFGSKVFGSASLVLGLVKFEHLNIGLFWIGVIFAVLVTIVFLLGNALYENDDRYQYE